MARPVNWAGDRNWRLGSVGPTERERRMDEWRRNLERDLAGMGKVKGGPVRTLSLEERASLGSRVTRPKLRVDHSKPLKRLP